MRSKLRVQAFEPAATRATASSPPSRRTASPEELLALGYDAQTAGGLLISLPSEKSLSLEAEFRARGLYLRRVGSVEAGKGLVVTTVAP